MADKEAIDIEDFRFLNFRKFSDNKRKVTRKKHMLNIESKEIYAPEGHLAFLVEAFATDGNSLLFVDNDCLLINGGTQKAMSLFTRKSLMPDKCGLGDACTIDENFVSPIPWISCDGKCQRWLHMHCITLKVVPKGNLYCDQCCKSKKVAKRKGAEQEKSNKPTKKRAPSKKRSQSNRK